MKKDFKPIKRLQEQLQQELTPPTASSNYNDYLMRQQVNSMYENYGDAKSFIKKMNPQLETYAAQAWERAYLGQAPTLACVRMGYGMAVAEVWLCLELESINTFSAARVKLDVEQQRCLARMILAEYGYLKTSEILLFVHRFKCGRYRQFYGSVDPQVILSSLFDFIGERRQERAALFDQQQKERLEQLRHPSPNAVSREVYERRKREHDQNLSNSNQQNPNL